MITQSIPTGFLFTDTYEKGILVFVPSTDEEDSLVTCGNLILSQQEN